MSEPPRRRFLWGLFERADLPILTALSIGTGLAIGVFLLPEEWPLIRRLLAGTALGLAALLSFFANRMIGGNDFD